MPDLIDGIDFVTGNVLSFQQMNRMKNHWYEGANPPSNPVNGMIWVKNDGVTYVYFGAAWVVVGGGVGDVTAAANLTDLAVIRGDGGAKGVKTSAMLISDAGEMTNTLQPAFLFFNSVEDLNVTGDGTRFKVDFNQEEFDQGGDFAADTFTAPVDGVYYFSGFVWCREVAGTYGFLELVTSNRTYYANVCNPGAVKSAGNEYIFQFSAAIWMDADDTAFVNLYITGAGGDTIDVYGHATYAFTYFSGYLAC